MRSAWIILLLMLAFDRLPGQDITFSRTYQDSAYPGSRLSSLSARPYALPDGYIHIFSGGGLNYAQGHYNALVKTDEWGNELWRKLIFDTSRTFLTGQLLRLPEAFVYTHGQSFQLYPKIIGNVTLTKLSLEGDTLWNRVYMDSVRSHTPYDVIQAHDGGFAITGMHEIRDAQGNNQNDILFYKTDSLGSLEQVHTYNMGGGDYGWSIVQTPDGGYLVSGTTSAVLYQGFPTAVLLKLDREGNLLWNKSITDFLGCYLSALSDGNYILSGPAYSVRGGDGRFMKIDGGGGGIWNKAYPYTYPLSHYIARETDQGNIVVVGITTNSTESNAGYIAKTDAEGNLLWRSRYNYNEYVDFFTDFSQTPDGGFIISGSARDMPEHGSQNAWLVKLDSMGCLVPGCRSVGLDVAQQNELGIMIYPNPARDWLNFKLPEIKSPVTVELYSLTGQRVLHTQLAAPLEGMQVGQLAEGLYLVKLTTGEGRNVVEKILIAK